MQVRTGYRELAARPLLGEGDATVRLMWYPAKNTVWLEVDAPHWPVAPFFEVPPANARDAYEHPFCYAP